MNHIRITTMLLIGAFALILVSTSAQAQRAPRGGTVTPPPPITPVASKL
jgi:hypothetical protein